MRHLLNETVKTKRNSNKRMKLIATIGLYIVTDRVVYDQMKDYLKTNNDDVIVDFLRVLIYHTIEMVSYLCTKKHLIEKKLNF